MIQIKKESQRVREGGSTRAAEQGGLKAEAADKGSGERRGQGASEPSDE